MECVIEWNRARNDADVAGGIHPERDPTIGVKPDVEWSVPTPHRDRPAIVLRCPQLDPQLHAIVVEASVPRAAVRNRHRSVDSIETVRASRQASTGKHRSPG